MKVGAGLLVATALLAAGAQEGRAESPVILAETPVRDGLMMGASIGRGSIDVECARCEDPALTDALSVALHMGFMLTPRLALLGEHWTVRYNQRGGAWFDDSVPHLVAQNQSLVAAQLFVTDSLWLKAGLGLGWHVTDGRYDKPPLPVERGPLPAAQNGKGSTGDSEISNDGAASFIAFGWEFAHNSVFAADLQFRVGATQNFDGRYQVLNTGVNVGFNWY